MASTIPALQWAEGLDGTRWHGATGILHWDPVIAPSGLAFYRGNLFPQWKNSVFVGGLRGMLLDRLTLRGGKVVAEEALFDGSAQPYS